MKPVRTLNHPYSGVALQLKRNAWFQMSLVLTSNLSLSRVSYIENLLEQAGRQTCTSFKSCFFVWCHVQALVDLSICPTCSACIALQCSPVPFQLWCAESDLSCMMTYTRCKASTNIKQCAMLENLCIAMLVCCMMRHAVCIQCYHLHSVLFISCSCRTHCLAALKR